MIEIVPGNQSGLFVAWDLVSDRPQDVSIDKNKHVWYNGTM